MAIMAAMLAVIVASLYMEHWKTKLLPLILGGLIFFLSAIELWQEIRGEDKAEKTKASEGKPKKSGRDVYGYLIAGSWVVGFLLCIFFLGFYVAIPLLTISYMKLHGTQWWLTILLAACSLGLMYLLSEPLAGIPLYRGMLFDG